MNKTDNKRKENLKVLLKIAISAVLIAILLRTTDIGEIREAFLGFDLLWSIPVLLAIALSMVVSASKWGRILKAQGVCISLPRLFAYYICGLFFNNFLPSSIGGDGARAVLAGSESGSVSKAASSVVMERILATVTLALLGLLGALFSVHTFTVVITSMSILLFVGVFLAFIQMTGFTPERIEKSEKKPAIIYKDFAKSSSMIRKKPKAVFLCLIESLIFQAVVALVVGSVMKGLGLTLPGFADLCMVVSASSVLSMIPAGINGYGLREGGYAFLLAPYGFSTAQAFAISVLYALFVTLFSLSGGPLWIILRQGKERKAEKTDEICSCE